MLMDAFANAEIHNLDGFFVCKLEKLSGRKGAKVKRAEGDDGE